MCFGPVKKPIQWWHVDKKSAGSMHLTWANTLILVHVTPPKHNLVHQTPYMCLLTASWWGAALRGDGCFHTRLYNGERSFTLSMIHFSHIFHTFPSLFLHWLEHWSANVHPPFHRENFIATVPENPPPPLPPSVPHQTDHDIFMVFYIPFRWWFYDILI